MVLLAGNVCTVDFRWFRASSVRASFLKDCALASAATTWDYALQSCVYRFCFSATSPLPGASPAKDRKVTEQKENTHTHTRSTAADTESRTQRNYRIRVNEQESESTTSQVARSFGTPSQLIQFPDPPLYCTLIHSHPSDTEVLARRLIGTCTRFHSIRNTSHSRKYQNVLTHIAMELVSFVDPPYDIRNNAIAGQLRPQRVLF